MRMLNNSLLKKKRGSYKTKLKKLLAILTQMILRLRLSKRSQNNKCCKRSSILSPWVSLLSHCSKRINRSNIHRQLIHQKTPSKHLNPSPQVRVDLHLLPTIHQYAKMNNSGHKKQKKLSQSLPLPILTQTRKKRTILNPNTLALSHQVPLPKKTHPPMRSHQRIAPSTPRKRNSRRWSRPRNKPSVRHKYRRSRRQSARSRRGRELLRFRRRS